MVQPFKILNSLAEQIWRSFFPVLYVPFFFQGDNSFFNGRVLRWFHQDYTLVPKFIYSPWIVSVPTVGWGSLAIFGWMSNSHNDISSHRAFLEKLAGLRVGYTGSPQVIYSPQVQVGCPRGLIMRTICSCMRAGCILGSYPKGHHVVEFL
jgi:hypothetical protein